MKRMLLLAALAVGAAVVTAACGGTGSYGSYGSYGAPVRGAGAEQSPGSSTVAVANSSLGKILVDGSGRTLYLFEADRGATSSCYGDCVGVWPADVTSGPPSAGAGVNGSSLSTTQRKDGTLEVVYDGHPLYYFSGDKKPGDVTGQNLSSFGAAWYVVSPNGTKIETDPNGNTGGY